MFPTPYRPAALARVLLVDANRASQLAARTLLEAAGYDVTVAASADAALDHLNLEEYDLVLSDLDLETPQAGLEVLAYARMLDYQPATGVLSAFFEVGGRTQSEQQFVLQDVPAFIDEVARMIGERASRDVQNWLDLSVPSLAH